MRNRVTAEDIARYHSDGFVLFRNFYDLERDILPIQRAVGRIIELVCEQHGLMSSQSVDPAQFDQGFADLISRHRALGGVVYDAVKQIPAFIRLVCSEAHETVYQQLRQLNLVGVAAGGYGIRIDNPNEERFRADWHQEYPAQLRSVDGAVFWSPLVPVDERMGPVRICVGSHAAGLVPVLTHDPDNPDKDGAYALILTERDRRVAMYPQVAPLLNPGDLLVMDFRTIHASGYNVSDRARWSMQSRLFNYVDPTGRRIGWCGSYAAGQNFQKIHPELAVQTGPERKAVK
jgi:hypothetical protein